VSWVSNTANTVSSVANAAPGNGQQAFSAIVFKGQAHVQRYKFINCQQALDGSTVLTLLPENSEVTAMTILRYGDQWSRAPRK